MGRISDIHSSASQIPNFQPWCMAGYWIFVPVLAGCIPDIKPYIRLNVRYPMNIATVYPLGARHLDTGYKQKATHPVYPLAKVFFFKSI